MDPKDRTLPQPEREIYRREMEQQGQMRLPGTEGRVTHQEDAGRPKGTRRGRRDARGKGGKAPGAARGRFRVILADCPWRFRNWSMDEKAKRGEDWARRNGRSPYDVLDTESLAALPVRDLAARDCVLLLWATWPKLPDALCVMEAWGWEFKSGLPWVKMTRAAAPRIGLGYHVRSSSELLLIGTRGEPGVPSRADCPVGVMFCPIAEHSAKPDLQYEIAEGYPGPYLELFHRPRDGGLFGPRPGWTLLGDAVDGKDIRDALRDLAAAQGPTEAAVA
jgi:N6-adenosine-specific RNA methylase IME4